MGNGIDDVRKTHEEGFVAINAKIKKNFWRSLLFILAMAFIFGMLTIAFKMLDYNLYSDITFEILCVIFVCYILFFIFIMRKYNKEIENYNLRGIENLIGKGDIKDNIEFTKDCLKYRVINSSISKVEITKSKDNTLVAKIYLDDGFILYPVKISSNGFTSILGSDEVQAMFERRVSDITLNKEGKKYILTVNSNTGEVFEYKIANRVELSEVIYTKNI